MSRWFLVSCTLAAWIQQQGSVLVVTAYQSPSSDGFKKTESIGLSQKTAAEYPGFNLWLTDNPTPVNDPIALQWDKGGESIPEWLTGTYMKIGPAQSKFGQDPKNQYQNMVDGWGKVNKFTFDKGQLKYTAGVIDTPLVQQFNKVGKMTAHSSLGPVNKAFTFADKAWPWQDVGTKIENNNVMINKMKWKGDNVFISTTDAATVNLFDPKTFQFVKTRNLVERLAQSEAVAKGILDSHEKSQTGLLSSPEHVSFIQAEAQGVETFVNEVIDDLEIPFRPLAKLLGLEQVIFDWIENQVYEFLSFGSCAHWKKQPGTENMLNYAMYGVLNNPRLCLYSYPEGDLAKPERVMKFGGEGVPIMSLIHEFSVTPEYAIFMCYPVTMPIGKIIRKSIGSMLPFKIPKLNNEPCLSNMLDYIEFKYKKDADGNDTDEKEDTKVVVVNLEDGSVTTSAVRGFYGTHHVNAYKRDDGKLVCDVVQAPDNALKDYTDKKFLKETTVEPTALSNDFNIARCIIDLDTGITQMTNWTECFPSNKKFTNQFDFPKVNPDYEGQNYQYAYGQAMIDFQRQYLIKKDLSKNGQDKIWPNSDDTDCQYSGEPIFIPRTNGDGEDDGVVLSIVLDGKEGKSYVLALDGKTFEELDRAYVEVDGENYHIPMSIHGNWFDEIL